MGRSAWIRRIVWRPVLPIVLAATFLPQRAVADDTPFLGSLSNIATREIRKQVRDKRIPFAQGPLDGYVQAVDPDSRLNAEIKKFSLDNDLLVATVSAAGRFRLDATLNDDAQVAATADVGLTIAIEARFIKEGDKFFVEPTIKNLDISLTILDIAPADLSGGQSLLSNLAMAAFNANKARIIAQANQRLGKRPF